VVEMAADPLRISMYAGSTIILRGPASARLVDGSVEVFGYSLGNKERVVAHPWKSLPLHATCDASLEIYLGEGGRYELIEENTIPPEWVELASGLGDSFRVVVIGGVDTGKTSLITFLYNKQVYRGEIAVADLDVGQSEICPPTTMGLAIGGKPAPSLSRLRTDLVLPYGYTSPSYTISYALNVARKVAEQTYSHKRLLVNTDGWIDHDAALNYKIRLIEILKPTLVVLVGGNDYGVLLQEASELGAEIIQIREPRAVAKRDIEARKSIREMNYTKALRGARLISLPSRWLRATPLLSPTTPITDYLRVLIREVEDAAVEGAPLIEGMDMTGAGLGILSYISLKGAGTYGLALFMGIDSKGLARIYTPFEGRVEGLEVGALILTTRCREVYVYRPPGGGRV